MKTGCQQLDGGRLYYEAAVAGDTLVLAHAAFVDRRMWDGQVSRLHRSRSARGRRRRRG
jgi:hypothetical protein